MQGVGLTAVAVDLRPAGDAGLDPVARAVFADRFLEGNAGGLGRRGVGRGPTIDMLPASTLNSCGSSSMLVLRMKRPTRVMRSSSRVVWRSALASVLSVYIERNLKTQISRLL